MPNITKSDAFKAFESGQMVFLGEYRSSEAEVINWRDSKSGKVLSAPILRHVVELGSKSAHVSERVPESFNVTEYKSPYQKGSKVVIHVQDVTVQRGMVTIRGALSPVQG